MKLSFLNKEKNTEIIEVEIDKIEPNPFQPRKEFEEQDIKELAKSIKNFGIIQPVTLRKKENKYEVIVGERRLRAVKYIKMEKIPAIIKDFNDQEMAEIALVENLQRKDLNFLEESQAYTKLIEKFNITQKELAQKIGKSQSTIANKLRLLKLSGNVREKLKSPEISERHARALLKINDEKIQIKVVQQIKDKQLTVKETESLIKKILNKNRKKQKITTVYKDLRIFKNSLNQTVEEMKKAGLEVKVEKNEDKKYFTYKIFLPKNKKKNKQMGAN